MIVSTLNEVARLLRAGKAERALERCRAVLPRAPKHPRIHFVAGVAAMQVGSFAEAVGYFETAMKLNPGSPEFANNLGTALIHANRPDRAAEILGDTVRRNPAYLRARINLAAARKACGDLEGAEATLREARQLRSDDPSILLSLADVLRARGMTADAMEAYAGVLALDPGDRVARSQLVRSLVDAGRIDEAIDAAVDPAVSADELASFGDLMFDAGRLPAARLLYARALAGNPACFAARVGIAQVDRRRVARWHFSMLNDGPRNDAYDRAIRATVREGDVVLDIGTGSGILAMMAARAGAGHVYACEVVPEIAAKAREIVALNGLADRITVIEVLSHDLLVGRDLPRQADVLVSEIVDNLLIGEGIMATLAHALGTLVRPGARIVPGSGRIHAVPIESPALFSNDRVGRAAGFDVSPFNEFTRYGNFTSDLIRPDDFAALGPPTELFSFDFTQGRFAPEERSLEIGCDRPGMLHGLLVWFALDLADGVTVDNDPAGGCGHWGHAVFFLDRPRKVDAGGAVSIVAAHDTTTVDIRFS